MRIIDRVMRAGVRVGIGRRGTALLETRGRRSGQPRTTPVTNGLDDARFWVVTEHGLRSDYVRNLLGDPHVRVNVDGRWRSGVAHLVAENPEACLDRIVKINPRTRTNTNIVRRSATDLRVIRIDLDD
jgi:deazaflavin-dependent oxidoreductase (nitroreductase family)